MSNKNKGQYWALWTEMNVKCTDVAISQHDWAKIFNGQNNQMCSFWNLLFFRNEAHCGVIWKPSFFIPLKSKSICWHLFQLRSTWVVRRTTQSTEEQWDLFEHISPCPRTLNHSISFSLSLQQIAQEPPTSGASRASSAEQRWNNLVYSLCLLCALLQ